MAGNKAAAAMPSEQEYQAQDDVRTLTRAHEIKTDQKRHARAKAHARKQLAAMQAIGGLSPMNGETKGEKPGET